MSKVNLTTIKNWFKTGLKPTQAQFWDTWDSFWHKDDAIPLNSIDGLQEVLNEKLDVELFSLDNEMSDTSTKAVKNKVAKAYADTKWPKEVIEIDDYNNVPLEVGYYAVTLNNNILNINTNAYRYLDNRSIKLYNYIDQAGVNTVIIKRELISNDIMVSSPDNGGYYFCDSFYSSYGFFLGTINKKTSVNLFVLSKGLEDFKKINENYYVKSSQDFSDKTFYKGFISLPFIEKKLGVLDVSQPLVYNNGLLIFPYNFQNNIKILSSEVIIDNHVLSNYTIGIVDDNLSGIKIGVNDSSGYLENTVIIENVILKICYCVSSEEEASPKITGFRNNSQLNIVNLETNTTHSNAMVLTFNEVYENFINTIFDANSANILDFKGESFKNEIALNNIDFMFSGSGADNMIFLKNTFIENSYGVIPCGSNNLIRIDLTDAIDKFPPNYISVTSRSEIDNTGTDPLGTSYGFGTEFNEPTLQADLTAQGLTGWPGDTEHQQSPATAIVAAKLKKIKDATNATWDIVREAARRSASNYGSYNIYRGFGVIDVAIAIAQVPNVQKERSLVLAQYWKHATPFNQNLNFEDKSDYTPVVKKDFIDKQSYISGRIGTELSNPTSPQALKFNEFWTDNGGVEYTNSDGKFTFKKAGVYLIKFNAVSQAVGTRIGVKKNQVQTSLADNHAQGYTPVSNGTLMIDMTMEFEKDDFIVFHLISGSIRNLTSDKFGQFSIIKIN